MYTLPQVVYLAILMFACRIPSLRRLDEVTHDARFLANWCRLSRATTETVVCSRQMTHVLGDVDPAALGALRPPLLQGLVRAKRLGAAMVQGHLMIAGDATGLFSSSEYHCAQCLTQHHDDGRVTYLHNVLEMKVLSVTGLALSVLSEPLVNPADGHYAKQDCETKAFHRALPRLQQTFPRQRIVHLLDSLYCNGPVFAAVEGVRHAFLACFKRGSLPTVWDEAQELLARMPENRLTRRMKVDGKWVTREYRWVTDLEHQGRPLSFVQCTETGPDGVHLFAWLTNLAVRADTVEAIAAAGRLRWKIENEGFNEQKTGYELEHFCDCTRFAVMYALYQVLQIAHLFMQLLAKSDLLEPVGTLTFLAALLQEGLRTQELPEALFAPTRPRMQIRFAHAPP